MTLIPRANPELPAQPDRDAELAVLADMTDPRATYYYERTIGDLIVEALVGRDLFDDVEWAPEEWESVSEAILKRSALELKATQFALAVAGGDGEHPTDELSLDEVCELMRGLSRRMEAGYEIARRLRAARWGHPNFGGGRPKDSTEERQKAADMGRSTAQDWLRDTKEGVTELSPDEWAKEAFEDPQEPWAFESVAPTLNQQAAWDAFRAGFALEIQKHGFKLQDFKVADDATTNDGGKS